ncbi:MAG: hypothetical protein H0W89_01125 [Candidatus Levybacteria bacterium]|nr:hypothetical protein [Candidatus Levybacteria bacterium]
MRITFEKTAYKAIAILSLIPVVMILGYILFFEKSGIQLSTLLTAIAVGVCLGFYHVFAQYFHQMGHALVARASGHPMTGIRYDYVFSYSEYPPKEPKLPAKVHILRSLGGLGATFLLLAVNSIVWTQMQTNAPVIVQWLLNAFLMYTIFFTIGGILSDGMFVVQKGWEEKK